VAIVAALAILALIALVAAIISAPLRNAGATTPTARTARALPFGRRAGRRGDVAGDGLTEALAAHPEGAQLAAAREAKYRELRDAELDYRTGKLARTDYESIAAALRGEALQTLNRIEAIERGAGAGEESDLQEQDRVDEQHDGEADGPAVEVALDHRATPEGPGAGADTKGAGEARVLAGVHEHQEDQADGNRDLKQ
jgi:hypothetical protein